jgi:hypothetical protein
VAGDSNNITAASTSVTGGAGNTASNPGDPVPGGQNLNATVDFQNLP